MYWVIGIEFVNVKHFTITFHNSTTLLSAKAYYIVSTIELVLQICCLFVSPIDANAGPLTDLDRLRRHYRLLLSITDQLKTKQSKTILAALILAKSKVIKKWKTIDSRWDGFPFL